MPPHSGLLQAGTPGSLGLIERIVDALEEPLGAAVAARLRAVAMDFRPTAPGPTAYPVAKEPESPRTAASRWSRRRGNG